MRRSTWLSAPVLLLLSTTILAAGQEPAGLGFFVRALPQVEWRLDTYAKVDANDDGVWDHIMLGVRRGKLVFAASLSPGRGGKVVHVEIEPDVNRLPNPDHAIFYYRETSDTPVRYLGAYPKGYRVCNKCIDLELRDGSIPTATNIYWNFDDGTLGIWRR
jgi:hypothetical protein